MMRRLARLVGLVGMVAVGLVAATSSSGGRAAVTCPIELPNGSEAVTLDPADFVEGIDNPWWPMAVGSRWVFREADTHGSEQQVVVVVKARTREILGISATVVHDVASDADGVIEDTFDWYAQDVCGNVWYLGENTKEYENGVVVSTAGSWEAGVDGALPGVIVPADPQVGLRYREEYYAGEAEDRAAVLSLDEQAQVPFGHFGDLLLTKNFTPVERRVLEYKLYAEGIGPVLALGISGGADREELVSFTTP